jgi:hypothetical protein
MGSIKLQIEPIANVVKQIVTNNAQINYSNFNNIMIYITWVCNSTQSKYGREDRPRVRVIKDDI